jgi:hypothetical protein
VRFVCVYVRVIEAARRNFIVQAFVVVCAEFCQTFYRKMRWNPQILTSAFEYTVFVNTNFQETGLGVKESTLL